MRRSHPHFDPRGRHRKRSMNPLRVYFRGRLHRKIFFWFGISILVTTIVVFVAAWIGQFIGHNIEGKKPSFLEDIKFLLIGPAWLLGFVYQRFGIAY